MIIGRTNCKAELTNPEQSLSKERYYFISHLSRDCLIKSKINSLPVSLNTIVKYFKLKVISYKKIKELKLEVYYNLMQNNYGFSQKDKNGNYAIFYDNELPIGTQRFTIAHEIGHILLFHFDSPIKTREKEANMFAARLLMPMCILHECKVKSAQEIKSMCDVSIISAEYRYKRLLLVEPRNKFYTDKNEAKLKKFFNPFIKKYLKNKTITE